MGGERDVRLRTTEAATPAAANHQLSNLPTEATMRWTT